MDQNRSSGRGRIVLIGALGVAAAIAAVGIYGIVGQNGNGEAGLCSSSSALAATVDGLATGEVAALIINESPKPAPELTFVDDTGAERALSDWKGRAVLFNLWATWCAPCRYEMPALDNLQAEFGGDEFEVVAVNIDTGGDDKPRKFLAEVKVDDLAYYADHTTDVFRELKKAGRAFGLPTTLLIDRDGCEIAHMAGPAEWDSDDAKGVVRALIGGTQQ
ncbi:thiol:disulfide interchange protein TlpA [Microbaculum sp. FT89]|uniref:thiol:disulfide interchange protein TlpA n=1 Tax=Microbaculum sp. FT89 TaxID=3447298 RepID=UPI003F5297C4